MKITRRFTKDGQDPFSTAQWTRRSSRITNPDGSIVFEMDDAEVPESWSQLATDIMVSKYFRKAGVPQRDAEGELVRDDDGDLVTGPEKSARQVIHRLAGCWRQWGEKHGYFNTPQDAKAFYDELVYMMVHQMCAPNSPQWFNTGLNYAYGITGPAQGHWVVDPRTGQPQPAPDAYSHPQPHACFIQAVTDDLVNDNGIMDLWTREARLFKYGSGTGTNFSNLRAGDEPLSGGGKSSGLMSWLKIGDRAAGAIKSGGTTRRAAKMVCLDMDHPDIEKFINWKVREEIKVAAMVEGLKKIAGDKASVNDTETIGDTAERLGLRLDYDFNGEAYSTVSGQNSNNSVRIPDAFFDAIDADGAWETTFRTTEAQAYTFDANKLWGDLCYAAWRCADPGVQFDTTINAWHTCPSGGRINASNPCSEYMFLDNTACNLASLNVMKFYDADEKTFDAERFEHAIDLWTMVLEISVLMAAFPSREIAQLSYQYRTLGLGYANLGAMLMQAGIPYDSEEGRAVCACLTAILTGRSYRMSALMAKEHGPFPGFAADRETMLRVIRNHRRAAKGVSRASADYEGLRIRPVPIDHQILRSPSVNVVNAEDLLSHAVDAWDDALALGEQHGFRNAQTTVIAPTGTIGLLMDCDTTGVEPDFALVKFKKLAGGGYFKIANASVKPALRTLGYAPEQVDEIMRFLLGALELDIPMPASAPGATKGQTFADWLRAKGLTDPDLRKVSTAIPTVFELGQAFGAWTLGDDALERLGIDPAKAKAHAGFSVLNALGLTAAHIDQLNAVICGAQTVEGAPHLEDEHLPVFDCANACGRTGTRFIAASGHIRMMAAAQPFISGAISKTINLPHDAKVEDIARAYRLSWELGLKANALYRDGCKLSQPLSSKSDKQEEPETIAEPADATPINDEAIDEQVEVLASISDPTEFSDYDDGDDEAPVAAAARRIPVDEDDEEFIAEPADATPRVATTPPPAPPVVVAAAEPTKPAPPSSDPFRAVRRRLPDTRRSVTHKFNVAGHEGYLTVGLYEDGKPGELFITMAKEGSTIGGLMDSLGTSTSVALQYGVPLESLVRKFTHQRFEPAGMTTNREIPFAKSLVDYIFRWLGMDFIPGFREANAPQRPESKPESKPDSKIEAKPTDKAASKPEAKAPPTQGECAVTPRPNTTASENGVSRWKAHEDDADAPGTTPAPRAPSAQIPTPRAAVVTVEQTYSSATLSMALESAGDAPPCDVCGSITVRSGTCYKCLNCGASMGCS